MKNGTDAPNVNVAPGVPEVCPHPPKSHFHGHDIISDDSGVQGSVAGDETGEMDCIVALKAALEKDIERQVQLAVTAAQGRRCDRGVRLRVIEEEEREAGGGSPYDHDVVALVVDVSAVADESCGLEESQSQMSSDSEKLIMPDVKDSLKHERFGETATESRTFMNARGDYDDGILTLEDDVSTIDGGDSNAAAPERACEEALGGKHERFGEPATESRTVLNACGDYDGGILTLQDDVSAIDGGSSATAPESACKEATGGGSSVFSVPWHALATKSAFGFKSHQVPPELARVFENNLQPFSNMTKNEEAALSAIKKLLKAKLNRINYRNFLAIQSYSLYHAKEKEVAGWRIEDAVIHLFYDDRGGHVVKVQGLQDKNPDVRKGDSVIVTTGGISYEMKVTKTETERVFLELRDKLLTDTLERRRRKEKCSIDFVVNDYVFKLHHDVLKTLTNILLGSLFPDKSAERRRPVPSGRQLALFNESIRNNEQQYQTVTNIVNGTSGHHPYVLFGPPGTGKTVTLVESIKQVWKSIPHSNILVATPSNQTADLLASKLLDDVPPGQIVRFNSRFREDVPADPRVRDICVCVPDQKRKKLELPKGTRIVCSTLVMTGCTWLRPFGKRTHIFIDEAGQALEQEILIPLKRHLIRGGQWTMAGDPYQLGPVVPDGVAKVLGMETSLLQRIMTDVELYQKDRDGKFDGRFVTRLVRNFRSHEMIIKLPSRMFYDNCLLACVDDRFTKFCAQVSWLKNPACPIMFHGVRGKHGRDGRSPSIYNVEEVTLVRRYVEKLVETRLVTYEDIGVICPYRKQVRMIKEALNASFGGKVDKKVLVGSTEQFQGQERKVMIISTVRSTKTFEGKGSNQLGFLVNPQRFNVSVTRAQSMLILIGDPHLLSQDERWGDYLEFAIANQAYIGCSFQSKFKAWRRPETKQKNVRKEKKKAKVKATKPPPGQDQR